MQVYVKGLIHSAIQNLCKTFAPVAQCDRTVGQKWPVEDRLARTLSGLSEVMKRILQTKRSRGRHNVLHQTHKLKDYVQTEGISTTQTALDAARQCTVTLFADTGFMNVFAIGYCSALSLVPAVRPPNFLYHPGMLFPSSKLPLHIPAAPRLRHLARSNSPN
eukprot:1144154-Pelagomonas_calceolata.AAC.8